MKKKYNFSNMKRNYKNVQHEQLRRKVDPKWTVLHDELSDCYYNYWKKGESKPFQGYDVQSTPEESKSLFDKLHGLIEDKRMIDLDGEYRKLSEEEKTEKMKKYFDACVDDEKTEKKIDRVKGRVSQLNQEGINIT
jgi:hypothetical protein